MVVKIFKQNVPSLFFLGLTYVVLLGGIFLALKIASVQQQLISYFVFGLLPLIGLFIFTARFREFIKTPSTIEVHEGSLALVFYLGRRKEVPLKKIFALREYLGNKFALKVCYQIGDRKRNFLVNAGTVGFGELLESIMLSVPNLENTIIDKFVDMRIGLRAAWGKEPDWNIINESKRRSAEIH